MKNRKKHMLTWSLAMMGLVAIVFVACSKDEGELPAVSTAEVTDVTHASAVSGGTVTDNGGSLITAMGVVWSTSDNPTVSDHYSSDGEYTIDGVLEREFTSHLSDLQDDTLYYMRAYAANETGVAYGESRTFETELAGFIMHELTPDMIEAWTDEPLEGAQENLVDGDTGTYWHSAWSSGVEPLPHWIKITFDEEKLIGGFNYTFRQPSGITDRPNHFDFQVSDNGTDWTTVWESQPDLPVEPVDEMQTLLFGENFSSQYFRIRILETHGSRDWTHLSTIEVYEVRD